MMAVVAQNADIKIEPAMTSSDIAPHSTYQTLSPSEETASPSPANSELFDRRSTDASGGDRQWLRYGSLESGASTGLTSMCSSLAQDDCADSSSLPTPSKRRKLDTPSKQKATMSTQVPSGNKTQHTVKATSQSRPTHRTSSVSDGKLRPRSSIPTSLPASKYANQCIEAAIASRLDPYSLHKEEHDLLVDAITTAEVTTYLNIRNSILRLWLQNPLCRVTKEEAAGCVRDARFFGLAKLAHQWLSRHGYINFGCLDNAQSAKHRQKKFQKQRTVLVIGAGVSGLTTARQLENHFIEHEDIWTARGERPPKVVVIEGRQRIGGRVYSKPLRSQKDKPEQLRDTAEMGAMIVTGFERGNPLDVIIRGQLGLRYHLLRDALTIYDCDGKPVKHSKDMMNTDLYADISDRTGEFRLPARQQDTLRGDEDLINRCRDPNSSAIVPTPLDLLPQDYDPLKQRKPISKRGRRVNAPPGTEKLTGRSQVVEGIPATARAARAAHEMGWKVRPGVTNNHTVSVKGLADAYCNPSLGKVMDTVITQYQSLLEFDSQDMRLLNWHHANLEYANAAPVSMLSLSGHDQDNGNEFEGAHSEIIGGYTQLPRGLMNLPSPLDVRFGHVVKDVQYSTSSQAGSARVTCTNGQILEADQVVITAPLGVLKSDMIDFNPPLPDWKRGAISHMGFGLLNKVILVYEQPFWDESRDMFGLLNEAEQKDSLDPKHYERRRGRFYLVWNNSKISGQPMLVALMAGCAAYEAETTDTPTLLSEITERLASVFARNIPAPREVIVTRWRQDPFSRGTYSYIAPWTQPGDYDLVAKAVGNLHFAGEATCGTHPATVHGALLSGLRAASDVLDAMAGPLELPNPLVEKSATKLEDLSLSAPAPIIPLLAAEAATEFTPQAPVEKSRYYYGKASGGPPQKSVCPGDPSYWVSLSLDRSNSMLEARIQSMIQSEIGDRPIKPSRSGVNPFLLYSKEKWEECKAYCSEKNGKPSQNVVRQVLSQWWKALDDTVKQPYLEQSRAAQETADTSHKQWKVDSDRWDINAKRIREDFISEHAQEMARQPLDQATGGRKTNVSTNIALDFTGQA